jgi:tetratricopeptide (TPR) repeat protein
MQAAMKKIVTRDRLLAGLVFALALLVRIIYLKQFEKSPFFAVPIIDANTYLETARQLGAGFWIQDESFWQPPLYPYFLGILLRLLGEHPFRLHLAHFILGSLNCALIYLLGRRLFSRPVALGAGLIAALYGTFIFFEGDYIPAPLIICLNLLLLLALLPLPDQPSRRRLAGAGLLFGLSTLAWPQNFLFLPAALLWLGWRLRPRFALRPLSSRLGLFLAAAALAILPATLHNAITSHELVLVSSNGGINFFIGNNLHADETMKIRPYQWDDFVSQPILHGAVTPGERSAWWYRRAGQEIRQDPLRWLGLLLFKTGRFFRGHEYLRNLDPYLARDYSSLLSVLLWQRGLAFPYGLIAPLGLLGLILMFLPGDRQEGSDRQKCRSPGSRPDRLLLAGFAAAQAASVVLYLVAARYRLPAAPALILAAAWLPDWAYANLQQKRIGRTGLATLAAAGLLLASNLGGPRGPEVQPGEYAFWQGYAAEKQGELPKAENLFRKMIAALPEQPAGRLYLGYSLAGQGRWEEAAAQFRQILELESARPGLASVDALLALARLARQQADAAVAAQHYRAALAIFPASEEAMTELARILFAQNQPAAAETVIQPCLKYYPRHPAPLAILAGIRWTQGRREEAAALYERAAKLNPYDLATRLILARYHAATGKKARARMYLDQVLARDPQNLEAIQLRAMIQP